MPADTEKFIQEGTKLKSIMFKAELMCREGNVQGAKDFLIKKYPMHEWNLELNYTLGQICYQLNDFKESLQYFSRCLLHQRLSEEAERNIGDLIENMCKMDAMVLNDFQYFGQREEQLQRCLHCAFPDTFTIDDGKAVMKSLAGNKFDILNKEYYCGICDRYAEERAHHPLYVSEDSRLLYKTEVLPGKQVQNYTYFTKEKTAIALMPLKRKQKITLKSEGIVLELDELLQNHYHYYKFDKDSSIEINSAAPFVVSEPILLVQDVKKPKVIINLFVDGLSQKFLDRNGIEQLMPNTYRFFKEGTICRNAYSNSEWTHPSLASTFTGRYTLGKTGHRIFQTDYCSENLYGMELFPEVLQQNGYFCAKLDGDWRATPRNGYAKGMNRSVFQPSVMNMFGDDAIMEMVEHLEAFKECNNFVWVALPDLHDISDEFESTVSTQRGTSLKYRKIRHTRGNSVRRDFDEGKIARYKAQLKRMDVLLGMAYSYIERNYREDEYIVSLMSDHGQGYFIPENSEFFEEYRNKIAVMYRGRNIPKGYCDELVESVDLFPTLLKCGEINDFDCKEGIIPKWFGGSRERKYTISESVFPESPYYAVINDKQDKFFFTTGKKCSDEGYLNIEKYNIKLVDKSTGEDVTHRKAEKVKGYLNVIFEHVREYLNDV